MKNNLIFFSLLFLASSVFAATVFEVPTDGVDYKHDPSQGTFVVGSTTYGYVTGYHYRIKATDDVTGKTTDSYGEVDITPQGSFPSDASVRTGAKNDASTRRLNTRMSAVLVSISTSTLPRTSKAPTSVGGTITFP